MVFAFLCHSVQSSHCRILFSDVFGVQQEEDAGGEEGFAQLNSKLLQVAGRVQGEFNFRLSTHVQGLGDREGDSLKLSQDETQGLFRLTAGRPFCTPKVVAWLVAHSCAFVYILDDSEDNRLLALHSLLTISTLVKDFIIKDQTPSEVLLKPDKMSLILMKFLPNGNMLFLNSKVVKQYEKEIEQSLKEK